MPLPVGDTSDEDVGPQPALAPSTAKRLDERAYGGALLRGEGSAMAAFLQDGTDVRHSTTWRNWSYLGRNRQVRVGGVRDERLASPSHERRAHAQREPGYQRGGKSEAY